MRPKESSPLRRHVAIKALILTCYSVALTAQTAFGQSELIGRIECFYPCRDIDKFYTLELKSNDKQINLTNPERGTSFRFLDIAPTNNMKISWFKTDQSEDGLYPLYLEIINGKVNGTFKFKKANDIFLMQKSCTLEKIKSNNTVDIKDALSTLVALQAKNITFDQNLYYSMLKELDYQMVNTLRHLYMGEITDKHIDTAREIKKRIFCILSSESSISNRSQKVIAQTKSWIEFARISYRSMQRNFAKEPTTIIDTNSRFSFFSSDKSRNIFIEDIRYIQSILNQDEFRTSFIEQSKRFALSDKPNSTHYPVGHFIDFINEDVSAEDINMAILSYYINALYDPAQAS